MERRRSTAQCALLRLVHCALPARRAHSRPRSRGRSLSGARSTRSGRRPLCPRRSGARPRLAPKGCGLQEAGRRASPTTEQKGLDERCSKADERRRRRRGEADSGGGMTRAAELEELRGRRRRRRKTSRTSRTRTTRTMRRPRTRTRPRRPRTRTRTRRSRTKTWTRTRTWTRKREEEERGWRTGSRPWSLCCGS